VYGICHDEGGMKESREKEEKKHGRRRNGRKEYKNKNKYTAPQPETVGENPRYGQG